VELKTPRLSTAIGLNLYAEDRVEYFSVFLVAAISATVPAFVPALSTQEAANGLTTVTSQTNERPPCHGIKVSQSGRLSVYSPEGFLAAGIPAASKARQFMSLRTAMVSCDFARCFLADHGVKTLGIH